MTDDKNDRIHINRIRICRRAPSDVLRRESEFVVRLLLADQIVISQGCKDEEHARIFAAGLQAGIQAMRSLAYQNSVSIGSMVEDEK